MSSTIFNPAPLPKVIPAGKTIWDYKLGDYSVPFVQVYYEGEWITLPMAKDGIGAITSTIVNAGRNAEAQVIGTQIGRTQSKIDTYIIPFLYAHEWARILEIFKDKINRKVRYFDQEANSFIEREMYVNDRKAKIYAFKQDGSGAVEIWKDAEIHFVDMRTIIIKWNLNLSRKEVKMNDKRKYRLFSNDKFPYEIANDIYCWCRCCKYSYGKQFNIYRQWTHKI